MRERKAGEASALRDEIETRCLREVYAYARRAFALVRITAVRAPKHIVSKGPESVTTDRLGASSSKKLYGRMSAAF